MRHFRLASRCHAQIKSIATKGSLMQRYGVVLQELRLEVLRNNNHLASVSSTLRSGQVPGLSSMADSGGDQGGGGGGVESSPPHASYVSEQVIARSNTTQQPVCDAAGLESNDQGQATARGTTAINRSTREDGLGATNAVVNPVATTSMEVFDNNAFLHMSGWGQFDSLVSRIDLASLSEFKNADTERLMVAR